MTLEADFDSFAQITAAMDSERRTAVLWSVSVLERFCEDHDLVHATGIIVRLLQDDEMADLESPRFTMSRDERDARDQYARGVIAGLRLANTYLTDPDTIAGLGRRLAPGNDEQEEDGE